MEEHHDGVNSTEELETLVSDLGVLFREFRGDGFLVVGEENLYIVKDHENNDFLFSELTSNHLQQIQTGKGYPTNRIERQSDAEPKEKQKKPCTEITIWTSNHTTKFYADAPVYKVAAAMVNFKTNCECHGDLEQN